MFCNFIGIYMLDATMFVKSKGYYVGHFCRNNTNSSRIPNILSQYICNSDDNNTFLLLYEAL